MKNKMSGIVWVITASIVFICIAVVAIFYKLTKLQEETREAYLKFDSYRMEKWNMVKRLAEYVESYHEEEKTFAEAHVVLDQDYMVMGEEEKSVLYHKMEEILGNLIEEIKKHGNLQCEEKIRNICLKLKDESYRYHEAEAEYNSCVNRYNGQIEKVPDKYVAGIFGLKKQKKL